MQLDDRRADADSCIELRTLRIDEQRNANARARASRWQTARSALSCPATSSPPSVVTSARRSGTRQQSGGRTSQAMRTISSRRRHLEIETRLQRVHARPHVAILDVPPILAQMDRDAVGAGLLGDQRGEQRIRIGRAPRLPQRGDVIDIDAEMDGHGGCSRKNARVADSE